MPREVFMVTCKGLNGIGLAAHIAADHVKLRSGGLCRYHLAEEDDVAALVCRGAALPSTYPIEILNSNAANKGGVTFVFENPPCTRPLYRTARSTALAHLAAAIVRQRCVDSNSHSRLNSDSICVCRDRCCTSDLRPPFQTSGIHSFNSLGTSEKGKKNA